MRFEVDSDQVEQAGAAVAGSVATVRTEVGALMRNLDALQATWHGPAAAAFGGTVTQWRGAQAQVEGALDSIQAALTAAARTYAEAEAAATRMFA